MRGALPVAVAGLLGCATSDDGEGDIEKGATARVAVESASGAPEQVVQRMALEPARVREGVAAGASLGVATGNRPAAPPRAHAGVPITSKHLEAELNRLEAELGR